MKQISKAVSKLWSSFIVSSCHCDKSCGICTKGCAVKKGQLFSGDTFGISFPEWKYDIVELQESYYTFICYWTTNFPQKNFHLKLHSGLAYEWMEHLIGQIATRMSRVLGALSTAPRQMKIVALLFNTLTPNTLQGGIHMQSNSCAATFYFLFVAPNYRDIKRTPPKSNPRDL